MKFEVIYWHVTRVDLWKHNSLNLFPSPAQVHVGVIHRVVRFLHRKRKRRMPKERRKKKRIEKRKKER